MLFFENTQQELIHASKPFLKWAGGKTQLLPVIQQALPSNFKTLKDLTYIEPFVGSGAVLFWMLKMYPNVKRAIINDINTDLTDTYENIKRQPESLIRVLENLETQYYSYKSEEERRNFFLEKRAEFNARNVKENIINSLHKSAALIFLNRTCFNGYTELTAKMSLMYLSENILIPGFVISRPF